MICGQNVYGCDQSVWIIIFMVKMHEHGQNIYYHSPNIYYYGQNMYDYDQSMSIMYCRGWGMYSIICLMF